MDDASGDGIAARLRSEAPSVRVVSEASNRGFGAACNRGARETVRPILLFLNSDAYVRPGAVDALVSALEASPGPRPRLRDSSTPTVRCSLRSSGCPRPGGSSARARASRFSRAAERPSPGTPRRERTTADLERSRRSRARRFSSGAPTSRPRAATRHSFSTRRRRIFWRAGAAWDVVSSSSRAPRWCTREEPRRAIVSSASCHASLGRYAAKHHGRAAAILSRAFLSAGAAIRYAIALLTPGERGRARRARYRAALSGAAR